MYKKMFPFFYIYYFFLTIFVKYLSAFKVKKKSFCNIYFLNMNKVRVKSSNFYTIILEY